MFIYVSDINPLDNTGVNVCEYKRIMGKIKIDKGSCEHFINVESHIAVFISHISMLIWKLYLFLRLWFQIHVLSI
jgi:hypothetical protein